MDSIEFLAGLDVETACTGFSCLLEKLDASAWSGIVGSILGALIGAFAGGFLSLWGQRSSREAEKAELERALATETLIKFEIISSNINQYLKFINEQPAGEMQTLVNFPIETSFSNAERTLILKINNKELSKLMLSIDNLFNSSTNSFKIHANKMAEVHTASSAIRDKNTAGGIATPRDVAPLRRLQKEADNIEKQVREIVMKAAKASEDLARLLPPAIKKKWHVDLDHLQ